MNKSEHKIYRTLAKNKISSLRKYRKCPICLSANSVWCRIFIGPLKVQCKNVWVRDLYQTDHLSCNPTKLITHLFVKINNHLEFASQYGC